MENRLICVRYLHANAPGAMGVITYFLLCGYTPFDHDSQMDEVQRILKADFRFEPEIYWQGVSQEARDFICRLLTVDPEQRMTAKQALQHPWLADVSTDDNRDQRDLLPDIKNAFNAKRTFRKAVNGIRMINRLRSETIEHQTARNEMEQQRNLAHEESDDLNHVWDPTAPAAATRPAPE